MRKLLLILSLATVLAGCGGPSADERLETRAKSLCGQSGVKAVDFYDEEIVCNP